MFITLILNVFEFQILKLLQIFVGLKQDSTSVLVK